MQLLNGADISIRFDPEHQVFIVVLGVGHNYTEFVDKDPVQALGVACLLQAGYTPEKLKNELSKTGK
jgi:hypothetical protein